MDDFGTRNSSQIQSFEEMNHKELNKQQQDIDSNLIDEHENKQCEKQESLKKEKTLVEKKNDSKKPKKQNMSKPESKKSYKEWLRDELLKQSIILSINKKNLLG